MHKGHGLVDASNMPKRAVADHWTNRAAPGDPPRWAVTGWHEKDKRAAAPVEHVPSGRGIAKEAKAAKPKQGLLL